MARVLGLDFARGIAILGILLANITAFSGPVIGEAFGAIQQVSGADAVFDGVVLALITGKCRGLLALLFGVGIAIQFERSMSWPGRYRKRSVMLALIGMLHMILLWFGDILVSYALTALIVASMASWTNRRLLKIIKWMFGTCISLGVLMVLPSGGATTTGDGAAFLQREISVFSSGSYLDQVALRLEMSPFFIIIAGILQLHLVPVFLTGVLLYRSGVLTRPNQTLELRRKILWWTLGLGVPLNLLGLLTIPSGSAASVSGLWEIVFAPFLAVGLLVASQTIAFRLSRSTMVSAIAKVGQFPLTNYILQSLLCTACFYGLRLFNRTSPSFDLAVVLGVWTVNLALSHALATRGRRGPLEQFLRS